MSAVMRLIQAMLEAESAIVALLTPELVDELEVVGATPGVPSDATPLPTLRELKQLADDIGEARFSLAVHHSLFQTMRRTKATKRSNDPVDAGLPPAKKARRVVNKETKTKKK